MQALPRWRSLLILKNSFIQSTAIASSSKTHLAAFHSTRVANEKWRNKWTSDRTNWTPDERSSQIPSKDYIKYKSRQKRADTKKALKNLLFNSGFTNFSFEETHEELSDVDEEDPSTKKDQSKSSHAARRAAKAHHKRMKRKWRREKLRLRMGNDDQQNVFQESIGKRRCTWSYWSFGIPFHQSSKAGFDFNKHSSWSYRRHGESDIESELESDTEACGYGTNSERQILGLPVKGPLNIQDVKNAFRLSALKWHPDKHQGPSQAVAGEKFKLCVDAYRSLCKSLSAA